MSEHVWRKKLKKKQKEETFHVQHSNKQKMQYAWECSVCIIVSAIINSLWIKTFVYKEVTNVNNNNTTALSS